MLLQSRRQSSLYRKWVWKYNAYLFIKRKINTLQPTDWIQWKNSSTVPSKWWHSERGELGTMSYPWSRSSQQLSDSRRERKRQRRGKGREGEREISFFLVPDKSPTLWLNKVPIVLDGKLKGHKVRWVGKGGFW